MLQKIVCLSYPPLLTLPTTTSPPFVNLTSYATGSGRRTLEPLPVLFAKAWQNCEYSTRGGVLPQNYLPITAAIARSPCQLPSPPSLLSLVPPPTSLLSPVACARIKEEGVKPLLVPLATPGQNCQYSARGGGAAKNCLPVISAITHSPCHPPTPP